MISDDEYLERVVAGVHAITSTPAEVAWNVSLDGRQFDVMITFETDLYKVLTVIEVRNKSRPVGADQIEAFVTKGSDAGANKLIFVSASGYQSGALRVAGRHGVDLHEVRLDDTAFNPPTNQTYIMATIRASDGQVVSTSVVNDDDGRLTATQFMSPQLIVMITECILHYADGHREALPTEPSQMTYYANKTRLSSGMSLKDSLPDHLLPGDRGTSRVETVKFDPAVTVVPPDEHFFHAGPVREIELTLLSEESIPYESPYMVEPTSFAPDVIYRNAIDGSEHRYPARALPIGEATFHEGAFYCMYFPLQYFYCSKVAGKIATLAMIESFQNGELVRVTFNQDVQYSRHYMKVGDQRLLKRLRARWEEYRSKT